MKKVYIIAGSLIACIFMYYVEQFTAVSYAVKTAFKLGVFLLVPFIYFKLLTKKDVNAVALHKKKDSNLGIFLGLACFAIILAAYFILQNYVDFNAIVNELQTKSKITKMNFVFVGFYITFGNSFLEEFFFRGFIFLELFKLNMRKTAYVFSSLLFAVYHIGIFQTWFNPALVLLALFALAIIGMIFNWLNAKSLSIKNSWIVHILADSAIILIGFWLFGIL